MYTFQDLIEYFSDRPEIQEQLIANIDPEAISPTGNKGLHRVLRQGFAWEDSPEGFHYWNNIDEELLKHRPQAL